MLNAHLFEFTDTIVSSLELFTEHTVVFLDTLSNSTLTLYFNLNSLQVVKLNKVLLQATRLVDLSNWSGHNSDRLASQRCGDRSPLGRLAGGLTSCLSGRLGGGAELSVLLDLVVKHREVLYAFFKIKINNLKT